MSIYKCTSCYQPWDGWGCVCNDCKRNEQLAEQNRLVAKQTEEMIKAQHANRNNSVSQFSSSNYNDEPWVPLTPEQLKQQKLRDEEAFRIYTEAYNNNGCSVTIAVLIIAYALYSWVF
jgi:hypothetical protein